MKTVLPNSSLAFIPPSSFMYSKTRDDFRSLLLVPVVASGSLVWHEVLTVSYETGRNRSVRYISLRFFHLFIMAGAHDEEKQETRESIYCNKCSTRKLGTSKKRSTQSARSPQSAWSAFQHDRGQAISGLRVTFLNKFRLGGGKAKVLITSTILKAK